MTAGGGASGVRESTDAHELPAAALPNAPVAMLLDFDGVVLESVQIKIDAFLNVYSGEDPARLGDVLPYLRIHGGVTRRVKFHHFETRFFGRAGDAAAIERLSTRYTSLVHDAVLACPYVPGALEFLERAHVKTDLHVVSGTPQDELDIIVDQRGLRRFFRSVTGAPATKPQAFARLLSDFGYAASRTLAVGDAPTEYWAAIELGIPFLGVIAAGTANVFPAGVRVVATLDALDERLGL